MSRKTKDQKPAPSPSEDAAPTSPQAADPSPADAPAPGGEGGSSAPVDSDSGAPKSSDVSEVVDASGEAETEPAEAPAPLPLAARISALQDRLDEALTMPRPPHIVQLVPAAPGALAVYTDGSTAPIALWALVESEESRSVVPHLYTPPPAGLEVVGICAPGQRSENVLDRYRSEQKAKAARENA